MRRAVLLSLVALAVVAPSADAHPLGNFTINHFSAVELSGDRAYVRYVLDLAEIPTFQARGRVAALGEDGYAARLGAEVQRGLDLRVDGRPVVLRELRRQIAFPPGQARLRTTRLEVVFGSGALQRGALSFSDDTFRGRAGWREVVVRASAGARVTSSSVGSSSVSHELRSYPRDLLESPLDITTATADVVPGSGPGVVPGASRGLDAPAAVRAVGDGGFAALVERDELPAGVVLLSLLIAVFWGAAHALSPGHGKSIVAAYLVGTHGTRRDALLLGLTVTVTHTIGVFALGLITLSLSQFIVPEDLYPWLNLASALLVVAVGFGVLRSRMRHARAHHHHHHHHHHEMPRGLLGVGISGGLIPCPTALVVLLAAISLHRVGYGLVLILGFSIGLAAAMTAIGIVAVTARRRFERIDFEGGLIRLLPAMSAFVILGLGLAMVVRAIPEVA
jgi:nickel/cobalt exporter